VFLHNTVSIYNNMVLCPFCFRSSDRV